MAESSSAEGSHRRDVGVNVNVRQDFKSICLFTRCNSVVMRSIKPTEIDDSTILSLHTW